MEIEVTGNVDLPRSEVTALIEATVRSEKKSVARIEVGFIDGRRMRGLNRRHRHTDRPTDVLSFPFDASFPQGTGGEVLICSAVVRKLAKRDGRDYRAALRETVIHGVLHVLGHADDSDRGRYEMARRAEAILKEASVGS